MLESEAFPSLTGEIPAFPRCPDVDPTLPKNRTRFLQSVALNLIIFLLAESRSFL